MRRLGDLLELIDSGEAVLPDFQRDFDWGEADVRSLIVTILSGWPAGSLLVMDATGAFFRVRGFEDGPEPADPAQTIVLDGQQRLTALYQALYDVGGYVYALDTSVIGDDGAEGLEDAVVSYKRGEWDSDLRDLQAQRKAQLIPLYALVSAADYFTWRDKLLATARESEKDALYQRLTDLYRGLLAEAHKYEFPVVNIGSGLEPAAVARIFERVNRTGMRLNAFDLVVARVYDPTWNLRDHWERARTESNLLDAFLGEDGMPVLQTIALRYEQNVRQRAVLELSRQLIRERWDDTIDAVGEALRFLLTRCGVSKAEWLPYRIMILPLAALAFDYNLEDHVKTLRQWFWSRTFALAYDAAANTRIVADYNMLRGVIAEGQQLDVTPASGATLYEATRRRQGPAWRGFMCVLADRDARDVTGPSLNLRETADRLQLLGNQILPVAVFPPGITVGRGSEPVHLRVLNLVLASREVARDIRRYTLASIAETAAEEHGKQAVSRALRSQLLASLDELQPLERDWRAFLAVRLEALGTFLKAEAGQPLEREG
jgi:hypothetical protein